jgi:hypothetical protein
MSTPAPSPPPATSSGTPISPVIATALPNTDSDETPSSIFLVAYPKIVFLYPTYIASLIAGFYMFFWGDKAGVADRVGEVFALLFLMLAAVNLVVLSFDFPRTTSLTLFFAFSAIVMGGVLLLKYHPDLLPFMAKFMAALKPWANAQFYFIFAILLSLLYIAVWITVRFDYWEVRPNELLHHHGFLSDLERFSAPNLRISKEINDVFEYLLLRSGRLILHPTNEPRAFVLDNVLNINRKEAQITKMLGALQVQVRSDGLSK